jgi:hypothetical protein
MDRYTSLLSANIRGIKGLIPWKMLAQGPIFGIKVNSWRYTPAGLYAKRYTYLRADRAQSVALY